MDTVKTYQNVDAKKEAVSFAISKMEDIYRKHGGKTDEPHRHNFFTVLVVRQAAGEHKIDFNTYPLGNRQIYFVAPGQVHQVIETEPSHGFVMTFSNQFLVESAIPLSFIDSLNLFQNYGQSPPLLPEADQFNAIAQFAQRIFELYQGNAAMKHLSIGAYLKLLLIECNAICAIDPVSLGKDSSKNNLIRAFKKLVDTHYRKEHSARFYANQLHMTPDHLNRSVKSKMGKTVKEYIQTRIVTEAKRLLYFTDRSNKEIGYALGFKEPANFSAFFKKQTQRSPSRFRKEEVAPQ
ncbi:AraC family transcriptional regulator [Maribacter sp. 2307ULW6-5]|uniref:AraC family transcriptional regulator n=1 Tax=Maribacter sp. 2307ULW6-5 TaxID=3386275 RepID=UPI0039BD2522